MSRPAIVDFLVPMTPKGAVDPDTVPARLRTPSIVNQLSSDELIARMDHFGIGQSIIPARRYGPHWGLDYAKSMISHGHPVYIERVAVDFPGLKIVATHTGYPWNRELVAVAEFRSNVWIGCDGFPPVLWPADLLNFIRGDTFRGVRLSLENSGFGGGSSTSDRCLFGSNYLSIHLETALPEIEKLGLDEDLWAKLMATNARDLYQLPPFEFDR